MNVTTAARPLAVLSALMSLLTVSPTKQGSTTIGATNVCATGTCCRQTGSICNAGAADEIDRYYLTSGPCPPPGS
jgi:hypothetical protein